LIRGNEQAVEPPKRRAFQARYLRRFYEEWEGAEVEAKRILARMDLVGDRGALAEEEQGCQTRE
jgi:hypothetical protein